MPEFFLSILKYLFLLLIFLFLARAVQAMYLEIYGPRRARGAEQARAAPRSRAGKPPERLSVTGPDGKGTTYSLVEELIIGRAEKCQVVLSDPYASQLHARVFKRESGFFMEDMGSTNGTSLNRKRLSQPTPVYRGDRGRIGKTDLEFK